MDTETNSYDILSEMALREKYEIADQKHVFDFWEDLDDKEREALRKELSSIDLRWVAERATKRGRDSSKQGSSRSPIPLDFPEREETWKANVVTLGQERIWESRAEVVEEGERILCEGKVGVFLVAGGQGTRLGHKEPKGCLEIGPLSQKTLFQLHAEKIAALGLRSGRPLPWYIMTSETNYEQTKGFFRQEKYFGLDPDNVKFLKQDMNPVLDDNGKLILESRGRISMSPNGHGGSYSAFKKEFRIAKERGLEHIFYFQVDNPLVRIADPLFLGLHSQAGADVSVKVCRKTGPDEKVGVIALEDGRPTVAEYSDLFDREATDVDPAGELVYWAGSIGIHLFRLDFFGRDENLRLPVHETEKDIQRIDEKGKQIRSEETRYETFVFDAFRFSERFLAVEVEREREFAPVKNKAGVDSLESARKLLVREHRRWLKEAGVKVEGKVEVSPLVALDAKELKQKLNSANWPSRRTLENLQIELENGRVMIQAG